MMRPLMMLAAMTIQPPSAANKESTAVSPKLQMAVSLSMTRSAQLTAMLTPEFTKRVGLIG